MLYCVMMLQNLRELLLVRVSCLSSADLLTLYSFILPINIVKYMSHGVEVQVAKPEMLRETDKLSLTE